MENKIYFNYHKNKYNLQEKQDIIKLIFQASLGPNHLGSNLSIDKINNYILSELNEDHLPNENLYEWISDKYIRINLFKYNEYNLDFNKLSNLFLNSVNSSSYSKEILQTNLLKHLKQEDLLNYNYQAVSHSISYKNKYKPHYRVINSEYLDLNLKYIQLDNFLNQQKNNSIIAIEGRCASGKTTLSEMFKDKYTIIDADDFFISLKDKSKETNKHIYGNINYKLLYNTLKEIKEALKNNHNKIIITTFDCFTQTYIEKEITLTNKIILCGTYSSSPYFKEFIDAIAFMNVSKETQTQRIKQRNLKERFFNEWIPLEEEYFKNNNVIDYCDIII